MKVNLLFVADQSAEGVEEREAATKFLLKKQHSHTTACTHTEVPIPGVPGLAGNTLALEQIPSEPPATRPVVGVGEEVQMGKEVQPAALSLGRLGTSIGVEGQVPLVAWVVLPEPVLGQVACLPACLHVRAMDSPSRPWALSY